MNLRRSGTSVLPCRLALAAAMPVIGIMRGAVAAGLCEQVRTRDRGAGAQPGHAVDLGEGAQNDHVFVGGDQIGC